jgi:hypothetical protein
MTSNKKFSAILAVLVIGFLSIYANNIVFNAANQTQTQLNITLNMQSGAQLPIVIPPGQNIPMQINNDQVVGITYNGQFAPAGANAVMQSPSGSIQLMWQMAGSTPCGAMLGGWVDTGEQS